MRFAPPRFKSVLSAGHFPMSGHSSCSPSATPCWPSQSGHARLATSNKRVLVHERPFALTWRNVAASPSPLAGRLIISLTYTHSLYLSLALPRWDVSLMRPSPQMRPRHTRSPNPDPLLCYYIVTDVENHRNSACIQNQYAAGSKHYRLTSKRRGKWLTLLTATTDDVLQEGVLRGHEAPPSSRHHYLDSVNFRNVDGLSVDCQQ